MAVRKVLLINPPYTFGSQSTSYGSFSSMPPLGLATIAAVLEKHGEKVTILDAWAEGLSLKEILHRVNSYDAEIIGITSDVTRVKNTLTLAKAIKSKNPNQFMVVGGPLPTIAPSIFNTSFIDLMVFNEGAQAFLEIVKKFPDKNMKGIEGVGYKKKNRLIISQQRPFLRNLNELPFPSWHLLPMEKYSSQIVITTRGCPHSCIFCSVSLVFGKRIRTRAPEYVIAMVETLVRKYKVKKLIFKDSYFNINPENSEKICEALIKKKLNIQWECNARLDRFDIELFRKMREAGCDEVSYGIESFDESTLNKLEKGFGTDIIQKRIQKTKGLGFKITGYFLVGFPWERDEDIKKTIRLAKKLKLDTYIFHFPEPLPKTKMWDYYCKNFNLKETDIIDQKYVIPAHYLKRHSFVKWLTLKQKIQEAKSRVKLQVRQSAPKK